MALLAMVMDVVTQRADGLERELVIVDLGLLKADHRRAVAFDQRFELMQARAAR